MVFQIRKNRGKIITKIWKIITKSWGKVKKSEASFRRVFLVSFGESHFCPWANRLKKNVDSNLSWKDHVDQVCLKVNRKIGALRRSFRQLTPTARQTFFLSVIQPDLEYAASAIVPSMAVSQKNRLLVTWRKAVRCAAGSGYQDNVTPLVKQLLLTLQCRASQISTDSRRWL